MDTKLNILGEIWVSMTKFWLPLSMTEFTHLESTADPGDQFEVTVSVPETNSIPNFNRLWNGSYDNLTD